MSRLIANRRAKQLLRSSRYRLVGRIVLHHRSSRNLTRAVRSSSSSPIPEGGTGEIVGRPLAEKLTALLGQPVNLEYQPGAKRSSGTQRVARAAPDGYTLLLGQTGELVINRYLVRDLGYDPDRDLRPVALVARIPLALVVKADAPFGTVDELIKAAKASRRGLSFSSGGLGTTGQFSAELLRLRSLARLNHVPSDGAAAGLRAVIEGQVDFYFAPLPVALPEVKAGKLKILAISLPRRSLAVPTVPTMIESGYRGFTLSAWVAYWRRATRLRGRQSAEFRYQRCACAA